MSIRTLQIACGEDFSVALDDQGYIYTTGSSEFGQLGNGETGEYFIAANKLGFANCHVFTRRTTFCHVANENKASSSSSKDKVVPLADAADIRIAHIACGKHHVIAVEAPSSEGTCRVFSWGCGSYGCLGRGVQQDEYFPRQISGLTSVLEHHVAQKVSAGSTCSLLVTVKGHVYYWGKHKSSAEAVMRPQLVDVLANNQHQVLYAEAGNLTVICSTAHAQTVAWGQGGHGELGLANKKKSSSKPTFVEALDGVQVSGLACGYGQTFYLVNDNKKLGTIAEADCRDLMAGK